MSKKKRTGSQQHRSLPPGRARREQQQQASRAGLRREGICGVCGKNGPRSKTHVPPQSAGNRADLSKRRAMGIGRDGQLKYGPRLSGGIWLFGLCESCNNAAGVFDPAYRDLVNLVRPHLFRHVTAPSGYRWAPPDELIRPGAIARSVLSGMFAFNSSLRERFTDLATTLSSADTPPIALPDDLRLRLAAFNGPEARVTGSYGGWYLRLQAGQWSDGVMTAANINFPPLAWHLELLGSPDDDEPRVSRTLLDADRWADVSHWSAIDPAIADHAADCIPTSLPILDLPERRPIDGWRWTWMFSDEICPIYAAEVGETELQPAPHSAGSTRGT